MKKIDIVCIIDDDPVHIFVTKKVLELGEMCESIMVFKNGQEAYDKLRAICINGEILPDVILLDLNMPIWDGWDFLDAFTQIPIEKKIIIYIVTSSNDPSDIRKAKSYEQVSNFIVKPITIEKLKIELKSIG